MAAVCECAVLFLVVDFMRCGSMTIDELCFGFGKQGHDKDSLPFGVFHIGPRH